MATSVINDVYEERLQELLSVCHKNLKVVNEDLIRKSFEFSYHAHIGIKRASGEPYFHHPLSVATILAEELVLDDVSVSAALLHDIIEDTDYEFDDISREFGSTVANIVDGATKITDIFKSHEVTEAESFRKLMLFMIKDIRVILVKFADRLHNMRTLQFLPKQKQKKIAQETMDIYAPLAHRFGLWQIKWEFEDLCFKYLNPEAYEDVVKKVNSKRNERNRFIQKFAQPILNALDKSGIKYELIGRPKHFYSIHNKMKDRDKPFEEIYDLFAVRLILDTDKSYDCFTVYGIVSDIYFPVPERFKDYISVPKHNGYQSIHTTVVGPDGKMVEVQIRTREMHEIAEKGIAAHWAYKEAGKSVVNKGDEWLNWVREIFEQADSAENPNQFIEDFKLNLFQDEIFIFTPKGDLKILPKGATPVDFAYDIHTGVGNHCIGAKVNGRIVPLHYEIENGDQVEIITSKNQKPNPDWEKFVITHRAKSKIRSFLNEERRNIANMGKDLWEKRLRRMKLKLSDSDLNKIVNELKYSNHQAFFYDIGFGLFEFEKYLDNYVERKKHAEDQKDDNFNYEKFVEDSRGPSKSIIVEGSKTAIQLTYAKCCNPIPGDDIIGFVTVGEGIKIHRVNCKNIQKIKEEDHHRLVEVDWPVSGRPEFMAALKVKGHDRQGLVKDLTDVISSQFNTNIRGINFTTTDGAFEGTVIIFVKDTQQLKQIIERAKRITGVKTITRFEE